MKNKTISLLTMLVLLAYTSLAYCESLAMEMAAKAPASSIITVADGGYDNIKDELDATFLVELAKDPQLKQFVQSLKTMVESSGVNLDIPQEPLAMLNNVISSIKEHEMHLGGRVAGVIVDKLDPQTKTIDACLYVIFDGGQGRTQKLIGFYDKMISDFNMGDNINISEVNIGKVGKTKQYSISPDEDFTISLNIATMGKYSILAVTLNGFEEKYMNLLADCSQSNMKSLSAFDGCDLSGDDIIMILNMPKYFDTVFSALPKNDPEAKKMINVFNKTGLTNMGPIYYRLGFDKKQFVLDCIATQYQAFTDMINPVNMDNLRAVPADATIVCAVNYNLEPIIDMYKTMIVDMAGQQALDEIVDGIDTAQLLSGVNLNDGLLKNFSGEITFSATCNQYAGLLGTTCSSLISVNDSKLFMDEMNNLMKYGAQEAGPMVQAEASSSVVDGVSVISLDVPQVMAFGLQPSFAIADKTHIVFGMSAASTAKSVNLFNSNSDKDTILSNVKFKAAFANSPKTKYAIQYCDSEIALKSVMATANAYWPLAGIAVSNFGITLPPLPQISSKFDGMPVSYGWSTMMSNGRMYSHMKTDGIIEATLGTAYFGGVGAFAGMQATREMQRAQMFMQMESDLQSQEPGEQEQW